MDKKYYKAFIRIIKGFEVETKTEWEDDKVEHFSIIREPLIIAKDKQEVKQILLEKYPQFFQNGKVYERKTKDKFQFFYVVIFELYDYEKRLIEKGKWKCAYCGTEHKNRYEVKPKKHTRLFGDEIEFCGNECLNNYKEGHFKKYGFFDGEEYYIKSYSSNYIYKITEKSTGKCYIGKTMNMPFFRWYNHYKHSTSPFGLYLRKTPLSDWTFEVLEVLPSGLTDKEVFKIESDYILKYDALNNGFNTLISNKESKVDNTPTLF